MDKFSLSEMFSSRPIIFTVLSILYEQPFLHLQKGARHYHCLGFFSLPDVHLTNISPSTSPFDQEECEI